MKDRPLSEMALGMEVLAQACATPWITSSAAPGCTTHEGAGQVAWICESLGVVQDAVFVYRHEALPENDDTLTGIGGVVVRHGGRQRAGHRPARTLIHHPFHTGGYMLTRIKRDLSFRTSGPVGMPAPRTLLGDATFPGLYMRPNGTDTGSIPAGGPFCESPDIWIAGQHPVLHYRTALATDQSYGTQSSHNVESGTGNVIYVRGRNGAGVDKTVTVQMYYAPSAIIQSPSQCQNNVIKTDHGQVQATMAGVAAGAVGVCDAAFLWRDPPPPPAGSDHYCLFAQFNDAANSNPFPSVETVFDMGALLVNNLGWGWRNTSMIPSTATWTMSEPLAIPVNYPTQSYEISVAPAGFVGWDVEFFCSETDANGNQIALQRSTIVQDGQVLGVSAAVLEGGFLGRMQVNLYSPNGQGPPVGATVSLSCNYLATSAPDLREAVHRGLVDWGFSRRMQRSNPELSVGPTALIPQGACSWRVTDNPAVRAWWEQRGHTFKNGRNS